MSDKVVVLWGPIASQGGYLPLPPNAIKLMRTELDLSFGEVIMVTLIMHHCRPPGLIGFPSLQRLADFMGIARPNASRMVHDLENKGILIVDRSSKNNRYDLSPLRELFAGLVLNEEPVNDLVFTETSPDLTLDVALSKAKSVLGGQIPDVEILDKLSKLRDFYLPMPEVTMDTILTEALEDFEKQILEQAMQDMNHEAEDSL